MDKYQINIVNGMEFQLFAKKGNGNVELNDDVLSLIQNENYNICSYILECKTSAIEIIKTDKKEYISNNGVFEIDIDFNEPITVIEFISKNNIVNPISLKLNYVSANKEAYNKKIVEEKRQALLEIMNAQVAKGKNLINIYWNLVDEKVNKTKVTLYLSKDKRYLTENIFDNNLRYISFSDLAYGSYYVIITQYNGEKEIVESDCISFSLEKDIVDIKATQPLNVSCNGGRHTVHN